MEIKRGSWIKLKDYSVLKEEYGTREAVEGQPERINLLVAVTEEEYKALDPNGDGKVLVVKVIEDKDKSDGDDTLYRGKYGAYIMPEFIEAVVE